MTHSRVDRYITTYVPFSFISPLDDPFLSLLRARPPNAAADNLAEFNCTMPSVHMQPSALDFIFLSSDCDRCLNAFTTDLSAVIFFLFSG